MVRRQWVDELRLFHFRNYAEQVLCVDQSSVILAGHNGAGKTNILEALSLLTPSKGLRSAAPALLQNISLPEQPWALHIHLKSNDDDLSFALGADPTSRTKKRLTMNQTPLRQTDLPHWVRVLWVTPLTDQLFVAPPSKRRKFLDKLAALYYPDHLKHWGRLELALRERLRLLKTQGSRASSDWLRALESQIAQESVIIAAQRVAFIKALSHAIHQGGEAFPKAHLTLEGGVETLLQDKSALEVEEETLHLLALARSQDMVTGTTSVGAHTSDFRVYHVGLERPAEVCSTGEQKALLLSIILAYTRLCVSTFHQTPLLLLDEVAAHLDETRRRSLFDEIQALGIQAWMTGTDEAFFAPLKGRGQFLRVEDASIRASSF